MWPGNECGITDYRDPSASHHIRFEIVNGLDEHAWHAGDDIGEHRWKHTVCFLFHGRDQFGPDKARRNSRPVVDPIGSREHVAQISTWRDWAIPHDIESPMTGVHGPVGTGDGVADQFLALWKAEIQGCEAAFHECRRRLAFVQHPTPR